MIWKKAWSHDKKGVQPCTNKVYLMKHKQHTSHRSRLLLSSFAFAVTKSILSSFSSALALSTAWALTVLLISLKIKIASITKYATYHPYKNRWVTYSCKPPRSTRVDPSLFLRARSSLSSLLFDFSASRSSLVRLFTAGIKLHTRWRDTSQFISPCFFNLANFIEEKKQNRPAQWSVSHSKHHSIVY